MPVTVILIEFILNASKISFTTELVVHHVVQKNLHNYSLYLLQSNQLSDELHPHIVQS
jgi:hypothetical protein